MNSPRWITWTDASFVLRGFLMGAADIVPGVSGGTVALIVGIYSRLVTAISHFDLSLVNHLRHRRWQAAVEHVDLRFCVALGCGILLGALSLASLMHYLLEHEMSRTLAVFFGLILASTFLVARQVERWTAPNLAAGALAALFAYWLCGQIAAEAEMSYGYLFFCAMIAICAMILPGISGAFVLLILGMYHNVTGVIKDMASGNITVDNILVFVVFGAGCALGLGAFSRILRVLLTRYEAATMTVLCGFMLGSLRRVWPFKNPAADYPPDTPFKRMDFVNIWPTIDVAFVIALLLAFAGFIAVLAIDWIARRNPATPVRSAETLEAEAEHIEH
ncbi:MAG: DUF368 domain-containing protein [Planctomycetales bacterium]|nr:DUF368 domain-containing protein [Planctomycetales bacterium]MCA9227875.1 DUF368 domain-containing protein [Planctomycetales bacterium]